MTRRSRRPAGCRSRTARCARRCAASVSALNERGIGANDRVAIVLDNGPEMATAFLGIGAGATAAPLNPSYRADEFEFYLTDLRAKLLVDRRRARTSPAIAVATKLGVPIAQLVAHAGTWRRQLSTLDFPTDADGDEADRRRAWPTPDDIALVLHTSGTTSRPKIVPLAQRNVCASAGNIRRTLVADERRRRPDRDAAVPHPRTDGRAARAALRRRQRVLHAGIQRAQVLRAGSARRIRRGTRRCRRCTRRSCCARRRTRTPSRRAGCASCARRRRRCRRTVLAELERVFRAPLVEAYGMTEASHQMASNPLPPARTEARAPSDSPAGPEVRVVDEQGKTGRGRRARRDRDPRRAT